MEHENWVIGDSSGLSIPADPQALLEGGATFLTRAFQHAGILSADNSVRHIHHVSECNGGSTGRKLFITVEYADPSPQLHGHLFVKFSRDFEDPIRDRLKDQLAPEVRLGLLSRHPAFPIDVPTCYFADYHQSSGTGLLITRQIPFGEQGVEPLYEKCLDYQLANPLEHYQTIITALATLAGTQQAGRFGDAIDRLFPFSLEQQSLHQPIRYSAYKLQDRVKKFATFAKQFPQLLPDHLRDPHFLQLLTTDIPRLLEHEQAIKAFLHANPDLLALMHWNANLDNGWYWRDQHNALHCGLMDWGSVGKMNMGLALWGALSAAELDIWDQHLDELLGLFTQQLQQAGGASISVSQLRTHLLLSAAMMGLAWLMDAPAMIQKEIPNLANVGNRFAPEFEHNETARSQLRMFTNLMNLWSRYRFGDLLNDVLPDTASLTERR